MTGTSEDTETCGSAGGNHYPVWNNHIIKVSVNGDELQENIVGAVGPVNNDESGNSESSPGKCMESEDRSEESRQEPQIEYENVVDTMEIQNASVQNQQKLWEMLTDENKLLTLEVEDVQKKCLKLEERLDAVKAIAKQLNEHFASLGNSVHIEAIQLVANLNQLVLSNSSDIIHCSSAEHVMGNDSTTLTSKCSEINDNEEENTMSTSTAMQGPAEVVNKQTVAKLGETTVLRRSKRKTVTVGQVQLTSIPPLSTPAAITNASFREETPPPPKLEPMCNAAIPWPCSTTTFVETPKKNKRKKRELANQEKFKCSMCGLLLQTRRELFFHQNDAHRTGPLSRYSKKTDGLYNQSLISSTKKMIYRKMGNRKRKAKTNFVQRKKRLLNVSKFGKIPITKRCKNPILNDTALDVTSQVESTGESSSLEHKVHEIDKSKDGYFCVCGTNFTSKGGLNVHVNYFTYDAKFSCSECDRKFFSTSLLSAHMKSRHDILFVGKNGCRKCGQCFSSRLDLYQHCKNVHNCGPLLANKKYKNDGKDKSSEDKNNSSSFRTKIEKEENERANDDSEARNVIINMECDKVEAPVEDLPKEKKSTLARRVKAPIKNQDNANLRSTRPKTSGLKLCEKATIKVKGKPGASSGRPKRKPRNIHNATKRTDKGLEVRCKCGKFFTTKSGLLSHVKLKTRGNVFKCPACTQGFPRSDYLRRHLKIVHEQVSKVESEIKKDTSDVANKSDSSQTQNTKHGISESKTEIKCLCGTVFSSEVTLNEHLRLKIGKKVFQCESCPESFSRFDYFKEHLRRAHRLSCEGMGCRSCGARGFLSHVELGNHRRLHHSVKTEDIPQQ